jgi:leucyl-tRNA synthetase
MERTSKKVKRNWIGKSVGAMVSFKVNGHQENISVFTTRPDTIFGVTFMTLAPEHELVLKLLLQKKEAVQAY